uniref:Si:ch73-212j7.3 n=1 Tax=Astyanax mexicanus TaxID=7994 RepID=W5KPF6_ASTMX
SDFPDSARPVSVVSTVSSGSGSSRDDIGPVGAALTLSDHSGVCVQNQNSDRSVNSLIPFASKAMAPNPQLTYLDRVIMEIIETERMYVRDLRSIVEDYLAHIIDIADLPIGPEQVCALFGNIEDIYEFNSSVAALTDCMRNKTLAKFFRERQEVLKRSLPLGSYLLKPVQRILKYHLLLQEIAKHFDPEGEGYEVVEEAIYTMTGVAWYINDMKRKHEHAVRLQEVQSLLINWKGPDLTTYGELVLEGTFRVHRAKNERTLFLFDRMLLITKRRGEHYVYKTHISCSTLMLIESAKDSLCFSVTHYKHPKQPHTVQARTEEERKLWSHHIKRLILENHQAVIPQKVPDVEHSAFYRYSPERLKKAVSQSEDFNSFQGRRQSEPEVLRLDLAEDLRGLNPSDCEEAPDSPSAKPKLFQEEERGEESGSDDILMEDDQVADFASSMLAAISCWHYRARALLSSAGFLTVRVSVAAGLFLCNYQINISSTSEIISHIHSTALHGGSTEELQLKFVSDTESTKREAQDRNDLHFVEPQKGKDEQGNLKEESDEVVPPLQQDLTPGESSEEEEEEEDVRHQTKPSSILPSSVLDKASAIAEHFVTSPRRSSLVGDDVRSLGCPSPRLPSRTGSSVSLAEFRERSQQRGSTSSEQQGLNQEQISTADFSFLSPSNDNLFELERGINRRRDSTLSKKDQQLISKIKSYYENAEHQDATFSLKRRESLTYIPSGLVSSSVSRFNNIPKDSNLVGESSDPVTGSSIETSEEHLFGSDLDGTANLHGKIKPESLEEIFRPSAEMIKVWQDMEREVTRSNQEHKAIRPREPARFRGTCPTSLSRTNPNTEAQDGDSRMLLEGLGTLIPRIAQLRAEADEKECPDPQSSENTENAQSKVIHLARKYSQRIKCTPPVVQQRGRDADTMFIKRNLTSVTEEKPQKEKGKPNLTLSLAACDKMTLLDQKAQVDSTSANTSGRVLSPKRSRSKSPLSPSSMESFDWPDVRELRSKYADMHSTSLQLPTAARSRSVPERMTDCGPRRRSICSTSLALSGASTEAPNLQNINVSSSYYISGEANLPNDKTVIVVEKVHETAPQAKTEEPLKEPLENNETVMEMDSVDDHYVQIRSPTSREKISIMATLNNTAMCE